MNTLLPQKYIYLDHCGTTPVANEVLETLQHYYQTVFGNPAAEHHLAGKLASELLERSRHEVAGLFSAPYNGTVFTGGATEANNIILMGFALKTRDRSGRILVGATEHKSILEPCFAVRDQLGVEVKVLPVSTHDGTLDLENLVKELQGGEGRPTLVATMLINNEIPARHPIEAIAELCHRHEAFLHCDAAQAAVREPLNFGALGLSSMVLSAHKSYGPKGVGVLILAEDERRTPIIPPLTGGGQERKIRPGTVNVPAIAAAAAAFRLANQKRTELLAHLTETQNAFLHTLRERSDRWHFTIPPSDRCPGIVSIWFDGLAAVSLLEAVPHICINRGSSCTSAGEPASHVPLAVGFPLEVAANVVRISFGWGASVEECRQAAEQIAEATCRHS